MIKKIGIINGPNFNVLGKREPLLYGTTSFDAYLKELEKEFKLSIVISYKQSNCEGKIIDYLYEMDQEQEGIILNAGAYSHTSLALSDTLRAIEKPLIEVHMTNIYAREEKIRHHSFLSAHVKGLILGFGLGSYRLALLSFLA